MNASLRSAVFAALMSAAALAACAKPDASAAEVAGTVADDPCAVVSKGEVRAAFPGAESGKRDHKMDQYGVASCTWETPTNTLAVQTYQSKNSAADELRGRMLGVLDPLKPALRETIQYDTIAGMGDEAAVVAVKADEAHGILADSAMLSIRRGERFTILFTRSLVDGDVAASKKALEALGRKAAARL
jgi:hypothetical protein